MRHVLAFAAAAALSGGALAQSDQDHAAHHPRGASAPVASASKAATPAQMDMQTKAMQDMHEKMMAAKTPEERQALMTEHMKTMQDGMSMMGQMHGTNGAKSGAGMGEGMSMSTRMMGKRMDMMEAMMQMVMDHEAVPVAGK